MGPGENAGAVDIGAGHSVAFKVESHNHPSAVEPFQGAATGIGGILRDVFAIGARPIAVLDSLRFGEPTSERSRYLFEGAVAGIGHYGNSIGVPNVGGEVYFEPPYEHNCLVNAMCVGLAETEADDPRRRGGRGQRDRPDRRLDGTGRDRRRVGPRLGRARGRRRLQAPDGPDRRPLRGVEAARGLPGAAGRRSCWSRSRTWAPRASPRRPARWPRRAGSGIDIDVGKVPLREPDLEPFEVMVSESQERMLAVVEPEPGRRGDRAVRALADERERDRRGDRQRPPADPARRRGGRRRPRSPRWWTSARCMTSSPPSPSGWIYGNEDTLGERVALSAGRSADREDPSHILMALLGSPEHRVEALGLRAVRLGRRLADRSPPRDLGRRRADDPRVGSCDRDRDRRQRPPGRVRPARRRRSRPCSSAPRTSPASAPSRSA